MAENLALHTLVLRDAVLQECLHFLDMCEGLRFLVWWSFLLKLMANILYVSAYGRNVSLLNEYEAKKSGPDYSGKQFVTYEARLLKYVILKIMKC